MITEIGDHASGVCVSTSLAGFAADGGGPGRTEVTYLGRISGGDILHTGGRRGVITAGS